MPSSGMLRRVDLVRIHVSEERSASFIRVTRISELEKTLAVTSNLSTLRRITKNRRFLQEPHGVTSQETVFFIVTAMKTSNLIKRRNFPTDAVNLSDFPRQQNRETNFCATDRPKSPAPSTQALLGNTAQQPVSCVGALLHSNSLLHFWAGSMNSIPSHPTTTIPFLILSRATDGSVTNNSTRVRIGHRIYSLWRL
jgi:hypothetical protein